MSKLDKGVAVLVVVTAAYFGGHVVAAGIRGNLAIQQSPTATAVIQEDDPRWDCATMGNRICGPRGAEVSQVRKQVGPGWACWAEDNDDTAQGWEVLCRKNTE